MQTLTTRQEKFALNLFGGMSQADAYIQAGYANNAVATVSAHACRLAKNGKVLARLEELREAAASAKIMSMRERKELLSEIARTNLTDFMELGQDGSWINIGKETPHSSAIQEIHSRTEYDDNGTHPTVHTSIKLVSKVQAIDLLNKMEKIYSDGAVVNVDNRTVNVIVASPEAKALTEKILLGERTG